MEVLLSWHLSAVELTVEVTVVVEVLVQVLLSWCLMRWLLLWRCLGCLMRWSLLWRCLEVLVEVVCQLIFGLCLRVPSKGVSFPKPEPGSRTEEGHSHLG